MRRTLLSLALVAAFACGDDDSGNAPPDEPAGLPTPDLRLLALTDLEGKLEPCGCTSRPLGGLDRTVARIAALSAEAPSALLVVGNVLFGPPHGQAELQQPAIWEAQTLLTILQDAGVAAITPGPSDLRHGLATFEALRSAAAARLLAGNWRTPEGEALPASRVIELGDHRVGLVGVSALPPDAPLSASDPLEAARRAVDALPDDLAARVVLLQGDRRLARRIAAIEAVDFVILGGLDQADALPPAQSGTGWVVYGGRQGQGVLVLDLYVRGEGRFIDVSAWSREVQRTRLEAEIEDLEGRLRRWEADGAEADDLARQRRRLERLRRERAQLDGPPVLPARGNAFAARWEPIDPDAPKDPAVSARLESLARRINDHNRRTLADRRPPPVAEGEARYVGSRACASCHRAAYAWWQRHPHGRAYATLQERHREFHLECVGCHVTGYEQPGGSTVTHNLDGALVNVGCEVCHGPGSLHVAAPSPENIRRAPNEQVCVQCHNEEHSDLFSYEAYRASLLVPGHGRPLPSSEP